MSKAKKILTCCIMFILLAIAVKPTAVHAAVNSNSKISSSDKKKIEAIRTDLKTALASEVYHVKKYGRRYFCNRDSTEEAFFSKTVTRTELSKIDKVVNNISQDILLKYKNKKYEFIDIVLWNFNAENFKIYNLSTINKLSTKEVKYYVVFCDAICENAESKYSKSVYGTSPSNIYKKDEIAYKQIRDIFKQMNQLYPREAKFVMQLKQNEDDYYVMKDIVEDTGNKHLIRYFKETEGAYQRYYNSKVAQRARDCIRIYSVEQVNLNKKIILKPRYIADKIKKWDGKKPIKKFVG